MVSYTRVEIFGFRCEKIFDGRILRQAERDTEIKIEIISANSKTLANAEKIIHVV